MKTNQKKTSKQDTKKAAATRKTTAKIDLNSPKFYASNVFDDVVMKKYLDDKTYSEFKKIITEGKNLNEKIAGKMATAMKEWAISRGATHFTHWFQPLNGITSEKHDSFLVPKGDEGKAIFSFSSKDLIKGEPDASSFPTGGLRATFEARGYTAWDPTSNAFIKDEVLCIPTAFCSYNGEALDKKTPLLRSMDALKVKLNEFLDCFENSTKQKRDIVVNIGAEQEFFLIPEEYYEAREDLVMCGKTLFGNMPCKGQELEEHYFGSIRPTVNNFMKRLDSELWSLGIAAHTKHNEAAPSQHELAPIFTNANRAVDENLLTMEKMKLLASEFSLSCLLNERPFDGINGSGKHCNWSITVDGKNLLQPGKTKDEQLLFFATLVCVISAVDKYQEILRASIANADNDYRLGANEAPPAIVSIYLGEELESLLNKFVKSGDLDSSKEDVMDLGASALPKISRDSSDRNRTSPFAFTSNKFEFRMPGSHDNLSDCVTVINTAFTDTMSIFIDNFKKESVKEKSSSKAILKVMDKLLKKHNRILFNGDGYSKEWERVSSKRGLANNKNTAEALRCMISSDTFKLFEKTKVMSVAEITSRYITKLDQYNKIMTIQARVMQRMVHRLYLPAISEYASKIAEDVNRFKKASPKSNISHHNKLLKQLLSGMHDVNECLCNLDKHVEKSSSIADHQKRADYIANNMVEAMSDLRESVDAMEAITPKNLWPVPSYNKMLFYV